MELKYYVLGTSENLMLSNYLNNYYNKLIGILEKLSKNNILSNEINSLLNLGNLNRDFILNPDNSSIINSIFLEKIELIPQLFNEGIDFFISKLKVEINLFLGGDYEKMLMNKGSFIPGTTIRLTTFDNNPYNKIETHPDHLKTGGNLGFGEKTEKEWLEIYEKTFNLLKKVDFGFYQELNKIIKKIIPLGTSLGVHNSASYKECIGHLYLGYTIDSQNPEINNVEAIIHESSHNKLNLLKQFDPLLLNDFQEKYYSAIRPDARHIHGVFIGYHAFAPTMYIIMKAYKDGLLGDDKYWFEKIVLYHIKTKFLQKIVKKYAKLTDLGKEISEEIDYVITLMDKIIKELNPSKEIILLAKQKQENHFKEVNLNYPYLEY